RKTGEERWRQPRPESGFSHSTPTLVTIEGKPQLLVAGADAIQGVDPVNGKVLWSCPAKGDTVSPVLSEGIVYCDSGRGGPAMALKIGKSAPLWKIPNVAEGCFSPVIADGYIYRLHNPGILKCWKLSDGKEMFSERL